MSKKDDDSAALALMLIAGMVVAAAAAVYGVGKLIWWGIQSYRNRNKSRTTTPPSTHNYAIDMSAVQRQACESEKKLFQSGSKKTVANDPWLAHCIEIENAWNRGDYDWARQQLQRIAYGMVEPSVTDAQRADFTRLMTAFAKEDPLYKDVMERVLPLVQANPGMLQSQIYKGQPDDIKEQMRYVLYFANELGHIRREKKGSSYKLYPPEIKEMYGNKFIEVGRENGIVTYETLPKSVGGTGAQITATIDEESAELLREATRLKSEKDWNGAIEALKKADARTGTVGVRLPLYLQQAGRFEEAMAGFNKLLAEVESQAAKDFNHHPERFWKGFSYYPRSNIYDKMRLACKRQKLPEEAGKYEALRDEFLEKHEKFRHQFDNWHKKDLEQRIANRGF